MTFQMKQAIRRAAFLMISAAVLLLVITLKFAIYAPDTFRMALQRIGG